MSDIRDEFQKLCDSGVWRLWGPLYQRRARCRGLGFHILLSLVIAMVGIVGYDATLLFAEQRGVTVWSPVIEWDWRIPALPWSVLIYLTLYFYFPLPLFVADRTLRGCRDFAVFTQGMVLLFLVSYGVFLTLPVEIVVRTQMEELVPSMSSPFAELFQLVYLLDRPWNAWPSLHVSGSLLIVLFIDYCWSVKEVVSTRQACSRVTLWLAWVALALSILTTKQHFLWDMVSGAVIGVLAWRWYVGPRLHRSL